jgi:putative GTP pyrophosphokinase
MTNRRAKNKTLRMSRKVSEFWRRSPDTIREFLDRRPDYEQLCTEIAYILKKRLAAQDIETSAVLWRSKTLNSFLEKLVRKSYVDPLADVKDFGGVRVVCLYLSDVSEIEKIIYEQFEVIEKVDKLTDKGADRFGYGAMHFVVRLGSTSSGARYDDLKELVCEVQVRSVLQDAWAIIDHHLVYKTESDIPQSLQRKMNSLAGLFETADNQFDLVRRERESYLEDIRESQSNPSVFLKNDINTDTLYEYLQWKYPNLPTDEFSEEVPLLRTLIDRPEYKTLADIDGQINKAENAVVAVIGELGEENNYVRHAAGRLLLSLSLVNDSFLGGVLYSSHMRGVIKRHFVK